jgi:hypothetical protein
MLPLIAAAAANPSGTIKTISSVLSSIGGIFGGSKPNPNDWQDYSDGAARHWTANDGDSPDNEALNVLQYVNAHGLAFYLTANGPNEVVTPEILRRKLLKKYPQEAEFLSNELAKLKNPASVTQSVSTGSPFVQNVVKPNPLFSAPVAYDSSGYYPTGTAGSITDSSKDDTATVPPDKSSRAVVLMVLAYVAGIGIPILLIVWIVKTIWGKKRRRY